METLLEVVCLIFMAACGVYFAVLLYGCLTGHLDPACIHFISPPPADMHHCS